MTCRVGVSSNSCENQDKEVVFDVIAKREPEEGWSKQWVRNVVFVAALWNGNYLEKLHLS